MGMRKVFSDEKERKTKMEDGEREGKVGRHRERETTTPSKEDKEGDSTFRNTGVLKLGNRHAFNGQGMRPLGGVLILRSNRVNSFESFSNPLSLPPMVVSPAKVEVETFLASCLSNR